MDRVQSARRSESDRKSGFTLIELLVVIAIIALLVGILLPALGKARSTAWKAVSLSNIRQITAAAYTYRDEQKQYMPLTLTYSPRGTGSLGGTLGGWCTWQYGGKNCDGAWASTDGGVFDVEAADRPLNAYMYSTVDIYAPDAPTPLSPTDPTRKSLELPVYKDPSEKVSYERSPDFENNPVAIAESCYDDTGTSYQFNMKWWDQLYPTPIGDFAKAFYFGCDRMRVADAFAPSRFVWINDQYSDVIANNLNPAFRLVNGYKDINKSVMGFMDGHANYLRVRPGKVTTPGLNNSYTNTDYTFVFEDLKYHP